MKRYEQLRSEERFKIAQWHKLGHSIRSIAASLERAASTVSRELKRNQESYQQDVEFYKRAQAAHECSEVRKAKSRSSRIRLKNKTIQEFVLSKLRQNLSPELIAGRLSVELPEYSISHEAIYQWLLMEENKDLRGYLLCAGKSHRRRRNGKCKRFSKQPAAPKTSIEKRPRAANNRSRLGDLEVDAIVSTRLNRSGSGLQVIVDRKSRRIFTNKVENLESQNYALVLIERLKKEFSDALKVHSITMDNGPEHAAHPVIAQELFTNIFFCHPYCSSERGSVENRNGIIRRFFPKGTDFSEIPEEYISHAEHLINNRPMKLLRFKTPMEVWNEEVAKLKAV